MINEEQKVNEYIEKFPFDVQEKLKTIRKMIKEMAMDADETMSYGIITYTLNGNLVHLGAYKTHIGFYPGESGIKHFLDEIKSFKYSKGTVQFSIESEIPYQLIRKIVEFRINENRNKYTLQEALLKIAKLFNNYKILWALGGSLVLKKAGLVKKVNDIDIIVHKNDVEKADRILSSIGKKLFTDTNNLFQTEFFYKYSIGSIQVDLMCNLKILTEGSVYLYEFDKKSIIDKEEIKETEIYYTSIFDWYILYKLMKRDEDKLKMIELFLKKEGIRNIEISKRTLKNVPEFVKKEIENNLLN